MESRRPICRCGAHHFIDEFSAMGRGDIRTSATDRRSKLNLHFSCRLNRREHGSRRHERIHRFATYAARCYIAVGVIRKTVSMSTTMPTNHQTRIVPALREIQEKFGYLTREALMGFSRDSGIPLHRLHSVASFFPHFRLNPPPEVTIRVCRDMACHLNGSSKGACRIGETVEQSGLRGRRVVPRAMRSGAGGVCDRCISPTKNFITWADRPANWRTSFGSVSLARRRSRIATLI